MQTFHEGQDVEVGGNLLGNHGMWRKGRILRVSRDTYGSVITIQFPDGGYGVFDAEHIRINTPRGHAAIHPMEALR
jgi:hypothetical protein